MAQTSLRSPVKAAGGHRFSRVALASFVGIALVVAACGSNAPSSNETSSTGAAGSSGVGNTTDSSSGASTADSGAKPLAGKKLVVATWGGAWTENATKAFYKPFEEDTGAEVIIDDTGSGQAAKLTAQIKAGKIEWDLLDAPGSDTAVIQNAGYLAQYPKDLVDHIKPLVRPNSLTPSDDEAYYLQYGSTTSVVVCNPDMVEKCPASAKEFFDIDKFPGDRAVAVTSPSHAMAFALIADGVDASGLFPIDIDRAIQKLRTIKKTVVAWPNTPSAAQQVVQDKEVGIALIPNGRARIIQKETIPNLQISFDGSIIFDEGWGVVKGSPNQDVAFAFIKWFVDHPEHQAEFTNAMAYMTPAANLADFLAADVIPWLPLDKEGTVQEDGPAVAKQASELGTAMQDFLVGG